MTSMITLTFAKPYRQHKDNNKLVKAFRYPFTVTRPGSGAKYDEVAEHEIEVSASTTLASSWNYSDADLERVLFEYGRQHLLKKLQQGQLSEFEELELHTGVASTDRPYDPAKIPDPEGEIYQFDSPKKIGF